MKDGSVVEERQPYLRGGAQEPLTRQDVTDKFMLNAQHGGWSQAQSNGALKMMAGFVPGQDRSVVVAWIGWHDQELTGKVAVVTGAGRNIGRAIALALAEGGASIVVNARSNRAEAEAVVLEIESSGGKALVHIGDVADAKAVQTMADTAMQQVRQDRLPGQQRRVAAGKIVRRNGTIASGARSSALPLMAPFIV